VADRKDDQIPAGQGPGDDVPGRTRDRCAECGEPLAADQRYCLNCGARRGLLPGAVAGTLAAISSKGKAAAAAASSKVGGSKGEGDDEGGWSWMPSPPAIAIAVIGMLALGVGLGSAMSEIADSAPISTILLEYPHHAVEAAPEEEPEEEAAPEEEDFAETTPEEETLPGEEELVVVPEEEPETFVPEGGEEEEEVPPPVEFNPEEEEESFISEEALPEIKHVFLIVLGEGGYESTFGAKSGAPYLSRTLPKKGTLIPNYYGVTGGVLANEIALLSGQGPTVETAANCPDYAALAPATVSATAEQVEGTGCVYPSTTRSLPTQLEEKALTWRAYVENMEGGPNRGQAATCRKPTLGGPDDAATAVPGDQYATWRNPVVYFSAIAESAECAEHDVGFEFLTRDLKSKKKTPALSLIFPDACHSGAEAECEPGAPKGAQGAAALLKNLVPAIMASPAYEQEGGLIAITSAEAPQAGENLDPSGCCLAPSYPNLVAAGLQPAPAATTEATPTSTTTEEEETETTTYTEENLTTSGGGGKVGLLMISPYLEPETVVEGEYANHFTLLKSLEQMFGVEPLGFATEAEMPTLKPELFKTTEEVEAELKEKKEREKKKGKSSKAASAKRKASAVGLAALFSRLLRSAGGSPSRAERHRGTS